MNIVPILLILTACGNSISQISRDKKDLNQNNAFVDTLKPGIFTQFVSKIEPVIFEAAFYKDTKVRQGNLDYSFNTLDIGKIKIESGKIIACDPIVMQNGIAFAQNFPIGKFPVQLAMAKLPNDERVAFSRIIFTNNDVAKWEVALQPGQQPISITDTTIYCYGVDAGTALFIDETANNIFSHVEPSEWENVFIKKLEEAKNRGFIHDFDGHNLATFSTGYGDGCYATYIGFDDKGAVCRLLTDFGLIEWWKL
jgi:hypothetical protein